MRGSRATLEEIAGRPVTAFAYPYGIHDRASIGAARAAGFQVAATCLPGRLGRGSDFLRLPRLEVRPCGGEELARSLSQRLADNVGAASSSLAACAG